MRCWGWYNLFSPRAHFGPLLLGRNILVSREALSCLLGGSFSSLRLPSSHLSRDRFLWRQLDVLATPKMLPILSKESRVCGFKSFLVFHSS